MLNLRRWLILLSFFLFITNTAIAQDDDDVVRVNTELVVINVTVTDGAGNYVRKLRASDFQVFEDGKLVDPKLIVGFALQESPYAAVVLLDSSGSMEARFSLARSAAIRFLDGLRPEDVAAVYRFDSKVERVQEFSGGRDLAPMPRCRFCPPSPARTAAPRSHPADTQTCWWCR